MKRALQDPGVKPLAVLRYAELNELCEGQESALQFLQYAVERRRHVEGGSRARA